jgi:hypothetical protein
VHVDDAIDAFGTLLQCDEFRDCAEIVAEMQIAVAWTPEKTRSFFIVLDALNDNAPLWTAPDASCNASLRCYDPRSVADAKF